MSAKEIGELNDKLRASPFNGAGRFNVTRAVHDRGMEFVSKCIAAVRDYKDFDEGNNPYGERDFGAFKVDGVEMFFQISYYDRSLQYGSPNPADPNVTCRVLTIMEVSDY